MADQDAAAAAARKAMFGRKSLSRTDAASAGQPALSSSSADVAGQLRPLPPPAVIPPPPQQQPTSAATAALLTNPADIQRLLQEQHFQQQEAEQRARQQHLEEQQRQLDEQRAVLARAQGLQVSPLASPSGLAPPQPDLVDQSVDPNAPSAAELQHGMTADGLGWMQKSSMQQAPVTVYYSKDPISHLQVRVILRKQPDDASASSVPKTFKQLNLAMKEKQKREEAQRESKEAQAATTVAGETSAAALNRSRGAGGDSGEEVLHGNPNPLGASQQRQVDALGRIILSPTQDDTMYKPAVTVTQLFSWQQKVVSPAEILLAALDPRGKTAASFTDQVQNLLRQHYPHEDLIDAAKKYLASQRDGMMLSSKRDHDRYIDPDDLHKHVTTSRKQDLNPLAERIVLAPLVNKRSDSHLTREGGSTPYHILATVSLPSEPSAVQLLNKDQSEISKHPPTVAGSFQKPLCTIKVTEGDEYCTLEMRPPFSMPQKDPTGAIFDDAEWYTFWTPAGECYRYRIENYSAVVEGGAGGEEGDLDPQQKLMLTMEQRSVDAELARMAAHDMQVAKHRSGREFDAGPVDGFQTMHVMGEIIKATGFIQENLCIAYEIDLRNNSHQVDAEQVWTTLVTDRLEAVTQSSQARFEPHPLAGRPAHRACYFSFPFEVKLSKRESTPALGPILYLQVQAKNAWGMGSVAGYGFLHLPLKAGLHEITVDTWVPLGTLRERRTGFFVGAGPSLRDIKMCGVGTMEKDVLNRYGWQSTSAGQIHLHLEVVEYRPAASVSATRQTSLALDTLRREILRAGSMPTGFDATGSQGRMAAAGTRPPPERQQSQLIQRRR